MATGETDSKRVLIADDEINIRRVLEAILRRDGYEVVTAANGEEALAGMSREVNTVITDLKMPGIDGIEVLKRVKQSRPEIEVIILTGHGSEQDRKTCEDLGAFAYLQKPVDIDVLTETLKKANEKMRQNLAVRKTA